MEFSKSCHLTTYLELMTFCMQMRWLGSTILDDKGEHPHTLPSLLPYFKMIYSPPLISIPLPRHQCHQIIVFIHYHHLGSLYTYTCIIYPKIHAWEDEDSSSIWMINRPSMKPLLHIHLQNIDNHALIILMIISRLSLFTLVGKAIIHQLMIVLLILLYSFDDDEVEP